MEEILLDTGLFTEALYDPRLEEHPFIIINEQILFFQEEQKKYVLTQISEDKNFTIDDYIQLPENAPYQLINGKLVFMPSPFVQHQKIAFNLSLSIGNHVKMNKLGQVLFAPCDVHFDKENIFQPDILYVSIARSSIIQKWIFGAPDFIIEILSKGTEQIDLDKKKKIYGKYNVKEYWIVYPLEEQIQVFHNQNGEMCYNQTAKKDQQIVSKVIEGFSLNLNDVF
jgi:Uma2 family endonuclease